MLFEEKERISQDHKLYGETDWNYLDRSGRVEAQRVRAFLDHWVTEYPNSDRHELISRISNGDNRNFQSATFELIVFALLNCLGCKITVHPNLPNGNSAHPDFLVVTPAGEYVYVEAVLASDYDEADISAKKRTAAVLTAIEKIESPDFFISIKAEGHPESPPSGKRLRKVIEQWLASLNPDTVAQHISVNGHDAIPTKTWQENNWNITFDAIPKKPECRGKGQRVIGALSSGARWINSWEPIRNAVKTKGNRYGELPHPLLIAINVDSLSVDDIDEMQALFGQEELVISGDVSAPPQQSRKPNGAWFGQGGPQYTRVSGAWIFSTLNPWNIVSTRNTVYFNPWASKPLPMFFSSLHHAKAEGDLMQWHDGLTVGEILSLSAEWPE